MLHCRKRSSRTPFCFSLLRFPFFIFPLARSLPLSSLSFSSCRLLLSFSFHFSLLFSLFVSSSSFHLSPPFRSFLRSFSSPSSFLHLRFISFFPLRCDCSISASTILRLTITARHALSPSCSTTFSSALPRESNKNTKRNRKRRSRRTTAQQSTRALCQYTRYIFNTCRNDSTRHEMKHLLPSSCCSRETCVTMANGRSC